MTVGYVSALHCAVELSTPADGYGIAASAWFSRRYYGGIPPWIQALRRTSSLLSRLGRGCIARILGLFGTGTRSRADWQVLTNLRQPNPGANAF